MTTTYQQLGTQIGELVDTKNAAYGSSFEASGPFLRLLFPNGIPADRTDDVALLVRIFDKQMRIATDQDAFGESPYGDIAGYGLLGARMHEERKSKACAFANEVAAAAGSKVPANSAAPSVAPLAMENASERSASNSAKPSSSPSQPTSASTAAPAPTAPATASANAVALELLGPLVRAARAWHDFHHESSLVGCDRICDTLPRAERGLAALNASTTISEARS